MRHFLPVGTGVGHAHPHRDVRCRVGGELHVLPTAVAAVTELDIPRLDIGGRHAPLRGYLISPLISFLLRLPQIFALASPHLDLLLALRRSTLAGGLLPVCQFSGIGLGEQLPKPLPNAEGALAGVGPHSHAVVGHPVHVTRPEAMSVPTINLRSTSRFWSPWERNLASMWKFTERPPQSHW